MAARKPSKKRRRMNPPTPLQIAGLVALGLAGAGVVYGVVRARRRRRLEDEPPPYELPPDEMEGVPPYGEPPEGVPPYVVIDPSQLQWAMDPRLLPTTRNEPPEGWQGRIDRWGDTAISECRSDKGIETKPQIRRCVLINTFPESSHMLAQDRSLWEQWMRSAESGVNIWLDDLVREATGDTTASHYRAWWYADRAFTICSLQGFEGSPHTILQSYQLCMFERVFPQEPLDLSVRWRSQAWDHFGRVAQQRMME